ncbi:MAG: hypothetical protein GY811_18330 [Myxococcales bacterium]|nr:hypothetical protein [Myxococcales bacterium]
MDSGTKLGLGAAAVATVLLVIAALSNSWLIGINGDITSKVGLRNVEICIDESSCESVALATWAESPYAPKGLSTFIALGTTSLFLAFLTAGFMLVLLAYAAAKKAPRWPVHPGSIALLLSIALLVVGVLTLALHPFKAAGWGTGPGFMMLGGGDVAALIAALFLGRSAPVSEDDWFE